jgi:uncharacterized protein (TIGR03083 family)
LTAIDRSVGGSVVLDVSAAYVEAQERLCAVLVNLDEEDAGMPVPACPGWSIRDVVAHHCGAVVDTLTGNLSELGGANLLDQWRDQDVADARDALTGREVAEREGRSLQSVLEEWKDATVALLPVLRGERSFADVVPPIFSGVLVNDVVVHEGDIRLALGLEPVQEGAALSLALVGYGFSLDSRLRTLGLRPLVLAYDGKQRQFGGDTKPGATLRASRYELVRALASRRSATQIRGYEWTGDAEPYIPVLPEYGAPSRPPADPLPSREVR